MSVGVILRGFGLAALFGGALGATDYVISSAGKTPAQLGEELFITFNACVSSGGGMITLGPGMYDLTGHYGHTDTYASGGETVTSRTHLYATKPVMLRGTTDAHWAMPDDEQAVVLAGDGRAVWSTGKFIAKNIHFTGFSGCDKPSLVPTGGNLEAASLGGAIRFAGYNAALHYATNCVFSHNSSRSGGAIDQGYAVDCLFLTNSASYCGGVGRSSELHACRCEGNFASNNGVLWWIGGGLVDTVFVGNHASNGNGVLYTNAGDSITNCTFVANYGNVGIVAPRARTQFLGCTFVSNYCSAVGANTTGGGALTFSGESTGCVVRGCRFEGNLCISNNVGAYMRYGGAINDAFASASDAVRVEGCVFVGNRASSGGGAVRGGIVTNCLFVGNSSESSGGALKMGPASQVVDCVFSNNLVVGAWDGGGGALYNDAVGRTVQGCVFVGNRVEARASDGKAGEFSNAGAIHDACTSATFVRDCAFVDNFAVGSGGAVYGGAISNCTFVGNASKFRGGAVYGKGWPGEYVADSTFTSNRIDVASKGSAYGAAVCIQKADELVARCAFVSNFSTNNAAAGAIVTGIGPSTHVRVVDCVFTNNFSAKFGIVHCATCSNVVFHGNEPLRGGGVVAESIAVDCRFVGNRKFDTFFGGAFNGTLYGEAVEANVPGCDALSSTLERCDLDGGCIAYCSLKDCTIHSLTNKGAFCAFYGWNYATNCLVRDIPVRNNLMRAIVYDWGNANSTRGELVNCTFANCGLSSYTGYACFFYTKTAAGMPYLVRNCLFADCRTAAGTVVDLSAVNAQNTDGSLPTGLVVDHCAFGVPVSCVGTWTDNGGNSVIPSAQVRFVGTAAERLGAPAYSLRYGSSARGKADPSVFANWSDPRDLAGADRLRDGLLDLGCYQCWLISDGTMMIFR